VETVKVTEESHYQSPKTLTESTSQSAEESPSVHVNIDTFKERTLQKGSEVGSIVFFLMKEKIYFYRLSRVEQLHLNVRKQQLLEKSKPPKNLIINLQAMNSLPKKIHRSILKSISMNSENEHSKKVLK